MHFGLQSNWYPSLITCFKEISKKRWFLYQFCIWMSFNTENNPETQHRYFQKGWKNLFSVWMKLWCFIIGLKSPRSILIASIKYGTLSNSCEALRFVDIVNHNFVLPYKVLTKCSIILNLLHPLRQKFILYLLTKQKTKRFFGFLFFLLWFACSFILHQIYSIFWIHL
jgi:hypothetical protein